MTDPADDHTKLEVAMLVAAFDAMRHCRFRVSGDGSMHEARKILTDAIAVYDQACRAPELVEAYRRKYPGIGDMWPLP